MTFYPLMVLVGLLHAFIGWRLVSGLATNRGTGCWGPPKRFGAPSEITLLRLVAA